MRLGGWSILMLSCSSRTPPHSYSCHIYVVGEQGRRLLSHICDCKSPLHLRAASLPAGQEAARLSILIPIELRYVNCILRLSAISELPALLSVMPHFIPPSTQSQSMASTSWYIAVFRTFWDFQTCPTQLPETTNRNTRNKVCEPNNKSFYLHWSLNHTEGPDGAKPLADMSHTFQKSVSLLTFVWVQKKKKCNHSSNLNISIGSYSYFLCNIFIQLLKIGCHKRLPNRKAVGVLRKTRRGRGEKRRWML